MLWLHFKIFLWFSIWQLFIGILPQIICVLEECSFYRKHFNFVSIQYSFILDFSETGRAFFSFLYFLEFTFGSLLTNISTHFSLLLTNQLLCSRFSNFFCENLPYSYVTFFLVFVTFVFIFLWYFSLLCFVLSFLW